MQEVQLPLVDSDQEVIDQPPPAKRQRLLSHVAAPDLPCTSLEASPAVSVRFKCNAQLPTYISNCTCT